MFVAGLGAQATWYNPVTWFDESEHVCGGNRTVYGSAAFKNIICKNADIYGEFYAEHVTIHGKLSVTGAAAIKHSVIKRSASIQGSLEAVDVTFNETVKVLGALTAQKVNFTKTLTLTGSLDLENCTTTDIIIKNDKRSADKIVLHGDTIVMGDITFESGQGKVYVYDTAQITGKVIGGVVINSKI